MGQNDSKHELDGVVENAGDYAKNLIMCLAIAALILIYAWLTGGPQ